MIISACIPCMNRTYDLKEAMPHIIKAANASPPVELMVLDYNSQDDLTEYVKTVEGLVPSNILSYAKYEGRDVYHMAHAYNLTVKTSIGEYILILGTDIIPHVNYFKVVRDMIARGCIWMHGRELCGVIVCQREEFIAAGGYDERFEFYGPEDKDLDDRLVRRGKKLGLLPNMLTEIYTSKKDKFKHYRISSRQKMKKEMRRIYEENQRSGTLVANEEVLWGQW